MSLDDWWDSLSDEQKILFADHVADDPLPGPVVEEFIKSGQFVAGGDGFADAGGTPFRWPAEVKEFLIDKAGEINPLK